jgi:1,2-dihydroxynaphthalene dioxygenase
MAEVTELGYMVLGVKSLSAWRDFAASILGLEVVDDNSKRCFLRMDNWHHRFMVEEDGSDDLSALGFRVAGSEEFAAMQKQLTDAGLPFRICSRSEAESAMSSNCCVSKIPRERRSRSSTVRMCSSASRSILAAGCLVDS